MVSLVVVGMRTRSVSECTRVLASREQPIMPFHPAVLWDLSFVAGPRFGLLIAIAAHHKRGALLLTWGGLSAFDEGRSQTQVGAG